MEQYKEKNSFTLWQYPLLVSHLEEMAQKGLMLSECDGTELIYDRCAPQNVYFAVTFFPAYDFLDPVPPPSLERLWAFCEESGWQHITGNASMQIFYNTQPNPVPLNTDAAVQLHNFDAMMQAERVKQWKQNVIVNGCVIAFLAVFFVVVDTQFTAAQTIRRVSPVMLIILAKNFYTFLTDGAKLLNYNIWYKKAEQLACEQNIFCPPKENIALHKTDTAVFTVLLAAMLFFMVKSRELGAALFWCIPIFLIIAVYIVLARYMRKNGVSAKDNRRITAAVTVLVIILLIMALPYILMFMAENGLGESFVTITREYPA